jgi:mono/diheme cytochrome c family protein
VADSVSESRPRNSSQLGLPAKHLSVCGCSADRTFSREESEQPNQEEVWLDAPNPEIEAGARWRRGQGLQKIKLAGAVVALAVSLGGSRGSRAESRSALRAARGFRRYCSPCHGTRGQGGRGADLRGLSDPPAAVAAIIANGQGRMPAFGRRLTPCEIRGLAVYVKGFR